MKILQVISSFPPAYSYGGALVVSYNISKDLVKKGHSVTVLTTDVYNSKARHRSTNNPEIIDGINVYRFRNISNFLSKKNFSCAPTMFFFLKNKIQEFDIIHLHEYRSPQAVFVHYHAKKNKIPLILQAHGSVLPVFEKQGIKKIFDFFFGNKILKDVSKLIAVSKIERDQYLKIGIEEKKIEIIPNGIDVTEYETIPEHGKFREKNGIRSDEKIILYLGRLHKRKGIDFLINTFPSLLDQRKDIRLVIAGPDDGFLSNIIKQVTKLGIDANVIVKDSLSDVEKKEILVDADVLIYPGIFEIFGLVPFEGIMCGTPAIVTDDCGCGEMIRVADCGYIIKFGDNVELRDRILNILNDDVQSNLFVVNGQNFIKNNLYWPHIVGNLERLYLEERNSIASR